MVFSLSALWWRRIRGLWKLPDGRDWLRGTLGLALMGRNMLHKSVIQFSVDGWGCVPSLLFTWDQTMMAEKAMAPHSSTLARKIPWTEEPGGLQSMRSLRVGHDWVTSLSLSLSCIGEGNGNPLQCSFLENPRDRGAWWATISGVTQSWTRLKWLSSSKLWWR